MYPYIVNVLFKKDWGQRGRIKPNLFLSFGEDFWYQLEVSFGRVSWKRNVMLFVFLKVNVGPFFDDASLPSTCWVSVMVSISFGFSLLLGDIIQNSLHQEIFPIIGS